MADIVCTTVHTPVLWRLCLSARTALCAYCACLQGQHCVPTVSVCKDSTVCLLCLAPKVVQHWAASGLCVSGTHITQSYPPSTGAKSLHNPNLTCDMKDVCASHVVSWGWVNSVAVGSLLVLKAETFLKVLWTCCLSTLWLWCLLPSWAAGCSWFWHQLFPAAVGPKSNDRT